MLYLINHLWPIFIILTFNTRVILLPTAFAFGVFCLSVGSSGHWSVQKLWCAWPVFSPPSFSRPLWQSWRAVVCRHCASKWRGHAHGAIVSMLASLWEMFRAPLAECQVLDLGSSPPLALRARRWRAVPRWHLYGRLPPGGDTALGAPHFTGSCPPLPAPGKPCTLWVTSIQFTYLPDLGLSNMVGIFSNFVLTFIKPWSVSQFGLLTIAHSSTSQSYSSLIPPLFFIDTSSGCSTHNLFPQSALWSYVSLVGACAGRHRWVACLSSQSQYCRMAYHSRPFTSNKWILVSSSYPSCIHVNYVWSIIHVLLQNYGVPASDEWPRTTKHVELSDTALIYQSTFFYGLPSTIGKLRPEIMQALLWNICVPT